MLTVIHAKEKKLKRERREKGELSIFFFFLCFGGGVTNWHWNGGLGKEMFCNL